MFWDRLSGKQQTIPNLIPSATSSVLSPVVAAEADSHALGAEGVSSSYGGDRLLSLPGTIYPRLLESILWPIELQIQDQVCGFLAVRQWSGSIAPQACWDEPGSLATQSMCLLCGSGDGLQLDSFGVPWGRILW